MEAYIILLFVIYISCFLTRLGFRTLKEANNKFLAISFIAIYVICALRDYSVGRDIYGYIEVYEKAGLFPLMDTTWTYMESGYVILMQLCSSIELSNRTFLCIVYALILYPIYRTIKNYSQDPLLSVIIFVCFQFFTFDLSGIRQGLATSFCLMSLPYAKFQKKKDIIYFSGLMLLAFLFHRSSLIFALTPLILRLRLNLRNIIVSIAALLIAPALTSFTILWIQDNNLSDYSFDDRLKMGGMLVFLFFILLFIMNSSIIKQRRHILDDRKTLYSIEQYTFILIAGIFFSLAFNGTMLGRAAMYYTIFMVYAIPNAIKQYGSLSQTILRITFHLVMLIFFYLFCLVPQTLDTVPYKMGTDLPF